MYKAELEHLFAYHATLQAPAEVIGPVPEGIRATFYVTGGAMTGPKLRGRVRPAGADWGLVRRDGMFVLDVRATLETDDGALIYAHYHGLGDLGADGYDKFARGELPPRLALRTAPVMRTAHEGYQWLHRRQFVGVGEADLEKFTVHYDVYGLR